MRCCCPCASVLGCEHQRLRYPPRDPFGRLRCGRRLASLMGRGFADGPPRHTDQEVRAYVRNVVIPQRETWVAVADGSVVGLLVLHEGFVSQLYLDPPRRGQSLGDQFVLLAKKRYPDGLRLWTFQVNGPAQRFYERHGFIAVEYSDGSGNEEHEPDIRYVWRGNWDNSSPTTANVHDLHCHIDFACGERRRT